MKRERDSQRARVYASDKALESLSKPLPKVADVEAYVERLFAMKRLAKKYPGAIRSGWSLPIVKDGRGVRRAKGGTSGIIIPLWARNEGVVCHELAHTIAWRHFGSAPAAHGWQYCAVYLDIVKWMMGRAAHDALKAAFKANKVRFRQPVKRKLTVEQRATFAERMRLARAA